MGLLDYFSDKYDKAKETYNELAPKVEKTLLDNFRYEGAIETESETLAKAFAGKTNLKDDPAWASKPYAVRKRAYDKIKARQKARTLMNRDTGTPRLDTMGNEQKGTQYQQNRIDTTTDRMEAFGGYKKEIPYSEVSQGTPEKPKTDWEKRKEKMGAYWREATSGEQERYRNEHTIPKETQEPEQEQKKREKITPEQYAKAGYSPLTRSDMGVPELNDKGEQIYVTKDQQREYDNEIEKTFGKEYRMFSNQEISERRNEDLAYAKNSIIDEKRADAGRFLNKIEGRETEMRNPTRKEASRVAREERMAEFSRRFREHTYGKGQGDLPIFSQYIQDAGNEIASDIKSTGIGIAGDIKDAGNETDKYFNKGVSNTAKNFSEDVKKEGYFRATKNLISGVATGTKKHFKGLSQKFYTGGKKIGIAFEGKMLNEISNAIGGDDIVDWKDLNDEETKELETLLNTPAYKTKKGAEQIGTFVGNLAEYGTIGGAMDKTFAKSLFGKTEGALTGKQVMLNNTMQELTVWLGYEALKANSKEEIDPDEILVGMAMGVGGGLLAGAFRKIGSKTAEMKAEGKPQKEIDLFYQEKIDEAQHLIEDIQERTQFHDLEKRLLKKRTDDFDFGFGERRMPKFSDDIFGGGQMTSQKSLNRKPSPKDIVESRPVEKKLTPEIKKKLGEALYLANKEPKKIRDEVQRLKSEIYDEGGLKLDDDYVGSGTETTYKEEIEWVDNYLENAERQLDDAIENGEKRITADEFDGMWEDYTIKEAEAEIVKAEKYRDDLQKTLDEAHEKISYTSDFRSRGDDIYSLKDDIIKATGEKPVAFHKFENDEYNIYPLYEIGGYKFHRKIDLDEAKKEFGDFKIEKTLDDISSETKIDRKFTKEDEDFLKDIKGKLEKGDNPLFTSEPKGIQAEIKKAKAEGKSFEEFVNEKKDDTLGMLFHGSEKKFNGEFRTSSYDGVTVWTAETPSVAQGYIPRTPQEYSDISFPKRELDSEISPYDYSDLVIDGLGGKKKFFEEYSDRGFTRTNEKLTHRDVKKFLESKGYKYDEKEYTYEMNTPLSESSKGLENSDYSIESDLYMFKGKDKLNLKDIRTENGELSPDYNNFDAIDLAKKEGYDGVIINDIGQSAKSGNFNHKSFGIFKKGLKKLEKEKISAKNQDDISRISTNEFDKYKTSQLKKEWDTVGETISKPQKNPQYSGGKRKIDSGDINEMAKERAEKNIPKDILGNDITPDKFYRAVDDINRTLAKIGVKGTKENVMKAIDEVFKNEGTKSILKTKNKAYEAWWGERRANNQGNATYNNFLDSFNKPKERASRVKLNIEIEAEKLKAKDKKYGTIKNTVEKYDTAEEFENAMIQNAKNSDIKRNGKLTQPESSYKRQASNLYGEDYDLKKVYEVFKKEKVKKGEKISESRKKINRMLPEEARISEGYTVLHNKDNIRQVTEDIKKDSEKVYQDFMSDKVAKNDITKTVQGIELWTMAEKEGNIAMQTKIVNRLARHALKSGQESQSFRALYPDHPEFHYMKNLVDSRLKGHKLGEPKDFKEIMKKKVVKIKKAIKKTAKKARAKAFNDFLDNFTC